jgi:hypothetical protein
MKSLKYTITIILNDEQLPKAGSVDFNFIRAIKNQLTSELYNERITDYRLRPY